MSFQIPLDPLCGVQKVQKLSNFSKKVYKYDDNENITSFWVQSEFNNTIGCYSVMSYRYPYYPVSATHVLQ